MQLVNKTIEISAAPEVVRQKVSPYFFAPRLFSGLPYPPRQVALKLTCRQFLDFSSILVYHPNGFIKTVEPARRDKPIEAGDRMLVEIELGKMEPIMIVRLLHRLYY